MPEQSAGEKTEQATPRRRQEARKRGTVAKSTELSGALSLLAACLVLPAVTGDAGARFLRGLGPAMGQVPGEVTPGSVMAATLAFLVPGALALLPLVGAVMLVGLAANFAQVGFVVSAEPLNPQLSRLNPLPGFQRLFSVRSSFDGFKAVGKMFLFGLIAFMAVQAEWAALSSLAWVGPVQAAAVVGRLAHTILLRISLAWLVLAVIDYLFQRRQVEKQLMMTKDELRREMREQEGSPEVKGAQIRKRRQLAKGALASKLKRADVLVTNPTHYAVAIVYDRSNMVAPMVLAKGVDFLALRMRDLARDLDVPVVENRPLARSLYRQCEAGDFVPRELFAPVAEVLAYVYQTLKRVKKR